MSCFFQYRFARHWASFTDGGYGQGGSRIRDSYHRAARKSAIPQVYTEPAEVRPLAIELGKSS
jgi:hypothetical protein